MKWDKTLFSLLGVKGDYVKIQQVHGKVSGLRDNAEGIG